MARTYCHLDPMAQHGVRIWTDYAIGSGITYKAAGNQKRLDAFWTSRKNKMLTSSQGQQELSRNCLIDGEVFFAIFGGEGQDKVLRRIDALQITDLITDPEDEETVLGYKRVDGSTPPKTLYYRDWAADPSKLNGLRDPETKKEITFEQDVVVKHHAFNRIGKRGNGLLFPVVSWSREHRRFMESRVAITQALAKFALKMTVKGGQKTLDAIQQKFQSTVPSGTGLEKNPPNSPGATWLQNQGIDLQAMPRTTGGGEARSDGDQLKLMVCAGTNVMLHYFGDPSTGNLATATAMELPMLKSFTGYQELWRDTWRDLFTIVLELDEEPEDLEVDLPAMLQDDLSRLGQFLMGLHQVFPEIQIPEILQLCLVALGVNDIDEVMKKIEAKRLELEAQGGNGTATDPALGNQLPLPVILPKARPGGPAPKTKGKAKMPQTVVTTERYLAAIEKLAEAIGAL
jgi:hypothetical protein